MRHGESEGLKGCFDDGDPALTTKGHQQAEKAAGYIALLGIKLVVVSDTTRTLQTAQAVMSALPKKTQLLVDNRISELKWGEELAGKSKSEFFTDEEEVRAEHEGLAYKATPDSQSVLEKAYQVLDASLDYGSFDGGNVLYVSHGETTKSLPAVLADIDRSTYRKCKVPHAAVVQYDFDRPALPVPIYDPSIDKPVIPTGRSACGQGRSSDLFRAITYA